MSAPASAPALLPVFIGVDINVTGEVTRLVSFPEMLHPADLCVPGFHSPACDGTILIDDDGSEGASLLLGLDAPIGLGWTFKAL